MKKTTSFLLTGAAFLMTLPAMAQTADVSTTTVTTVDNNGQAMTSNVDGNANTAGTVRLNSGDVNDAAMSMKTSTTTYSYDANNNGVIDRNEFITYVTRTADTDNDGYIVSDEYNSDSMVYFASRKQGTAADAEIQSYSYWDKDQDKRLDSSEVESLVANGGLYKQWDYDQNGTIETSEFMRGTFSAYDDNGDNMISMEEWADVIM